MGVTYAELDAHISGKNIAEDKSAIIERLHKISEHKRKGVSKYDTP